MLQSTVILTPVIGLITWTLVIWAAMYATRIPAMGKAQIAADDARHPGSLNVLPSNVRSIADNYNHLHEQPTVFYALAFYIQLSGGGDSLTVNLAWAYVALRVVHSLIQCTSNKVMLRFPVFVLSSIVLMVMTARSLLAL